MNRALLYIRRKKGKSFTLFMLLFLISTFVTTSLALMYTTHQVSRFMRELVDGRVEIRQLPQEQRDEDGNVEWVFEIPFRNDYIKEITLIEGIGHYNGSNRGFATADDLSFRQGSSSGETDHMGSIQSVNDSSMLSDFREGQFSLVLGRHIIPEDEFVVMISETLAAENNLTLGDAINLRPAEIGTDEEGRVKNVMNEHAPSVQATIVGIFAEEEVQWNSAFVPAAGIVANQLFVDHRVIIDLGLANANEYEAIAFQVNDPSDLGSIIGQINQLNGLNDDSFLMMHDDGDYMRISGDLQTIQNLIGVLLIAIGSVSAIILALILILRMRGRLHEVGILLSVGIGKKQIWGGLLLEIILITLPALMVSYGGSRLMVPILNRNLLADLPALAELGEQQLQTMSFAMYGLVYGLILLIVLATAYLSTLLTIRLKPKQILSKMS